MSWVITGREAGSLGLLDQYAGAAAAYSLRSLTLYYTGPVVRVRRSSDNTEQDFTATQVTDGTLTTFCGAGNGFVRTWYDQSGNDRHLQQETQANQPTLVASGALQTAGGKPIAIFDTTDILVTNFSRTNYAAFCVFSADSLSDNFCVPINTNGTPGMGVRPTLKLYDSMGTFNVNAENNTVTLGERLLVSSLNFANNSTLYKNSASISAATGSFSSRSQLAFGSASSSIPASSSIQEVVFYINDQSSNRTAIESNINAHYAIY
jgi:hypothetical protein